MAQVVAELVSMVGEFCQYIPAVRRREGLASNAVKGRWDHAGVVRIMAQDDLWTVCHTASML